MMAFNSLKNLKVPFQVGIYRQFVCIVRVQLERCYQELIILKDWVSAFLLDPSVETRSCCAVSTPNPVVFS